MSASDSAPVLAGMQWDRWSTQMHLLVTDGVQLRRARAVLDS